MKTLPQTVITVVFLFIWLFFAYKPWFRPKEYINTQKRRRTKPQKTKFYLPQSLTYSIFRKYPKLDLWSARFISLLGILICIIILLSSKF